MEKIEFSKSELLNRLVLEENELGEKKVKLYNDNVRILMRISSDKQMIDLIGFYKKEGITKKGIARCSLFVLLLKLKDDELVNPETKIKVQSPRPDDGNMDRLIRIYEEIGFNHSEPEPGNPINLIGSVEGIIEKMGGQCEMTGGGKYIKYIKYIKTKSKRRKSKNSKKRKSKKKSKKRKTKKRKSMIEKGYNETIEYLKNYDNHE